MFGTDTVALPKVVLPEATNLPCMVNTAISALSPTFSTELFIPDTDALFSSVIEIVPLQLLAYYVAKANGCDIDKPKNLAKSVTVE